MAKWQSEVFGRKWCRAYNRGISRPQSTRARQVGLLPFLQDGAYGMIRWKRAFRREHACWSKNCGLMNESMEALNDRGGSGI
jgi:hypothetical protein